MRWPSFVVASALILLSFYGTMAYASPSLSFDEWLSAFRQQAAQEGISAAVIDEALSNVEPDEQVVTLDQKQPEGTVTLTTYLKNSISPRRVRVGKALMHEYADTLKKISAQYGVQPQYIVALWGIESDYGNNKGNFSVIQSLATLAYEGRRAEFFSRELIAALKILDQEHMASYELAGSWAGAMGDCQFMPSTYLKYAADGNRDGRKDIWNTPADVFASIANYLHGIGWKPDQGWGYPVQVPDDFTTEEADIKHAETLMHWHARGLKHADGTPLPKSPVQEYAIYPGSVDEGAYLVTENYQSLLQWNRSRYFATAVGMLADKLGE